MLPLRSLPRLLSDRNLLNEVTERMVNIGYPFFYFAKFASY